MAIVYKVKRGDLSELCLHGHRTKDGSILLGEDKDLVKEFPKKVKVLGRIYDLKAVAAESGTLEIASYTKDS